MLSRTVSYLIEFSVRAVSEFGDKRQAETGIFMHAHDRQIHTTGPILSVFPALIVHSELKCAPRISSGIYFLSTSYLTNNVVFNLFALTFCYFG